MILYKNNYEEDERLFSTGNEELDDLLEEVYYSGISDGYDYAQREFSEEKKKKREEWKEKHNKGENIGRRLTKAGLITAGAGYGTSLVGIGGIAGATGKVLKTGTITKGNALGAGAGAVGAVAGRKAGRIGLGLTAAGLATRGISSAVRSSKEKNLYSDIEKVKKGKMSKGEFKDKYGYRKDLLKKLNID